MAQTDELVEVSTQMKLRHVVAGFALVVTFQVGFSAQKSEQPRFENYPADVWAGKPAPLNLRSHRQARMFRTSIREQLHERGINFAGHYTIAVMGCGTGCSITAIVDARNGRAYFPRVFDGWTSEIGDYQFAENEDIRSFRTNSRLLRVVGRPRLGADERWGPSGIYYYEWKADRLRQVQFVPASSYPKPDTP